MVAWVIVIYSLSGFSGLGGRSQPAQTIGQGVTVTPAAGWVSAKDVWNVGPNAISLKRGGALVAFAADAFSGSTQELLDQQVSDTEKQFGSFRALPAGTTTVAGGQPALKVLFSGTSNSSSLEGEIVAFATGRTGAVMVAIAPAGQIIQVQGDLDSMLKSLVIPK
jgi:hypothetical protein